MIAMLGLCFVGVAIFILLLIGLFYCWYLAFTLFVSYLKDIKNITQRIFLIFIFIPVSFIFIGLLIMYISLSITLFTRV